MTAAAAKQATEQREALVSQERSLQTTADDLRTQLSTERARQSDEQNEWDDRHTYMKGMPWLRLMLCSDARLLAGPASKVRLNRRFSKLHAT